MGTRSSEVQRIERALKTANKKLDELVVDRLRRYDYKYGKLEKELSENRQARIACERILGAVAVARKDAAGGSVGASALSS